MLVRTNTTSYRPNDGHLASLVGGHVLASEFTYKKGREIFGESEDAEYVYQIISGAVRTSRLLPDGRRQINSFHLPGDMFGFENGASHRYSAEAIVNTTARVVRRRSLVEMMTSHEGGANNLIKLITGNLQHAETHMLLLGRKTSLEKVAAFLLEMDERQHHPDILDLPMNRRDIADYLGLTLETVSRALSRLRDTNALGFEEATHRRVALLDRSKLEALNE